MGKMVDYFEANKVELKRIKTPFPTLGIMLSGGFVKDSFILVRGIPGSGKISLMSQVALATSRQGVKTYFVEGEMTELEIYEKAIEIMIGSE